MNKTVKIVLIIAVILIPVGIITAGLGVLFGGKTGWSMSSGEGGTVVMSDIVEGSEDLDEFDTLDLKVASMDVNIIRGDSYKLSYRTEKGFEPEFSVENGTLSVTQPSKVFTFFSFDFDREGSTYTITVPEDNTGIDIEAVSSSGDIMVDRIKAYGKIITSSGDVLLNDLEGSELSVTTSSGEISSDKLKEKEITIVTSSGDVQMLRTETDDISGRTSSGEIEIYDSVIKNADFKASSGDIKLELNGNKDDYSYEVSVSSGDISINGDEFDGKKYSGNEGKDNIIRVETSSGDVEISVN